jgi:hypothetical protein
VQVLWCSGECSSLQGWRYLLRNVQSQLKKRLTHAAVSHNSGMPVL